MARYYFRGSTTTRHAIFYYYGFAIHGTNDISRLASGIAWLRETASGQRRDIVRAGRTQRTAQHADRDFE
jgi:hypothetical protein